MPIKITMPALSPTMTEGKLAKWVKGEGDAVEAGDVIAEIETDKATMEVEAVDEGKIVKILVPEGTEGVAVNEVIAVLVEEDEGDVDVDAFLSSATTENDNAPAATPPADTPKTETSPTPAPSAPPSTSQSSSTRVKASPLAKRLARQMNIDLTKIKGSGPHGRIVKADLEKTPAGGAAPAPAASAPAAIPQGPDARQLADALGMPYTAEENSQVRKVIASRLLEAKQTVPHYYLTIECNIDALMETRKQLNKLGEEEGYKVSVNDFIIKAMALALRKVPQVNSSWTDAATLMYENADISVAVATDNGLITPIVKDADKISVVEISKAVKDLAGRAKEGTLKPEEFQGGNATVSNLGMFGIKEFSAIINPPQSCILAVGAGEQRAVVIDGELTAATMMSCTASFDHRSVDGAVGAQFLSAFKDLIENPAGLLLAT